MRGGDYAWMPPTSPTSTSTTRRTSSRASKK